MQNPLKLAELNHFNRAEDIGGYPTRGIICKNMHTYVDFYRAGCIYVCMRYIRTFEIECE